MNSQNSQVIGENKKTLPYIQFCHHTEIELEWNLLSDQILAPPVHALLVIKYSVRLTFQHWAVQQLPAVVVT